jgi:D-sedoheptulose 7-phosphate isomerase
MSKIEERIRFLLGQSIEAKVAQADYLTPLIKTGAQKLVHALLNEGKILACGQGGSVANVAHFTSALLNRFEVERPPLPVLSLCSDVGLMTGLMAQHQSQQLFSRQIQALGQPNDVLLLLTTSGNIDTLIQAVTAAKEKGMDIIALTGPDGGVLTTHLGPDDLEISIPVDTLSVIREIHLFILHAFCDLIDNSLFGQLGM